MRRLSLIVVLGAAVIAVTPKPAECAEKKKPAVLVIDFGDGFQKRYTQLPVTAKSTVLDLLRAAAKHPRGVRFKSRGAGETAFVTEIDGQKNEGNGRNWVFRVNGKLGKKSSGVAAVTAGDEVTWRFQKYRLDD